MKQKVALPQRGQCLRKSQIIYLKRSLLLKRASDKRNAYCIVDILSAKKECNNSKLFPAKLTSVKASLKKMEELNFKYLID